MTFQQRIKKVRDTLTGIEGLKVYHFFRPQMKPPFCLWQEDGPGNEFRTGNRLAEQMIHGTIDYFTAKEYDEAVDLIQSAFRSSNISLSLTEIMWEEETELIHYGWEFEV